MGLVQESIGLRWEEVLKTRFPQLIQSDVRSDLPDFYHPEGFWIEAKAGNRLWGGRVKSYQFEQVSRLDEPVVYAFGMHDLDNALRRVSQKTERGRQRYLSRHLRFVEIYFVSGKLLQKVHDKEKRISRKEGLEYCMIKPSILRNILQDRAFSRFGTQIGSAEAYYGFDRSQYVRLFEGNTGLILHETEDRDAIKVFSS